MVRSESLNPNYSLPDEILAIYRTNKCRTVGELVKEVEKHDRTISFEEIRDAVEVLREERTIILSDPPIERSFISYVKSTYLGNIPLWMTLVASTLTLGFAFLSVEIGNGFGIADGIRIAAGAAAVLIVPGYGLSALLFPKREHEERLSTIGRLGIGFGLTFAMIPVLWLALMQSPGIMRIDLIVLSISAAGILLNFGALYRNYLISPKKGQVSEQPHETSPKAPAAIADTAPQLSGSKDRS